jgi:hypothetical protein
MKVALSIYEIYMIVGCQLENLLLDTLLIAHAE